MVLASAGFAPPSTPLRASRQPTAPEQGCGCACCLCPRCAREPGRLGRDDASRRSGADLSASGRGGESRSPCPRHYGVERAPSQSLGIHFDSRTYWFEPGVRADGRLFLWSEHHYGGPLTPRGARSQLNHPGLVPSRSVTMPRAIPLLVWSERRRAGQRFRASMTATDGRLALRRVSRSNGTPRWEARGSMFRWTLAFWVPFSPSPSTLS